jgi:hypothetical protein
MDAVETKKQKNKPKVEEKQQDIRLMTLLEGRRMIQQ